MWRRVESAASSTKWRGRKAQTRCHRKSLQSSRCIMSCCVISKYQYIHCSKWIDCGATIRAIFVAPAATAPIHWDAVIRLSSVTARTSLSSPWRLAATWSTLRVDPQLLMMEKRQTCRSTVVASGYKIKWNAQFIYLIKWRNEFYTGSVQRRESGPLWWMWRRMESSSNDRPRTNEEGSEYGRGFIAEKYTSGYVINKS